MVHAVWHHDGQTNGINFIQFVCPSLVLLDCELEVRAVWYHDGQTLAMFGTLLVHLCG